MMFIIGCSTQDGIDSKPQTPLSSKEIKPRACTVVGCINLINVKLPESVSKLPSGQYELSVTLNHSRSKNVMVVSDKSKKECSIELSDQIRNTGENDITVKPSWKKCSSNSATGYNSVDGLTIIHFDKPKTIGILIKDKDGKVVFKTEKIISNKQISISLPNGVGCGECYKTHLDLR